MELVWPSAANILLPARVIEEMRKLRLGEELASTSTGEWRLGLGVLLELIGTS